MSGWRIPGLLAGVILGGAIWGLHHEGLPPADASSELDSGPAWGGLTVSKETTLLTGPLRPDGTVDYIAALNEKFGAGVTPENNALAALLPAIGTGEKTLGYENKLQLAALGGEEAEGTFTAWVYEAKENGAANVKTWLRVNTQYDDLQLRAWRSSESPEMDRWVKSNESAINTFLSASSRPKFFMPFVSRSGLLEDSSGTQVGDRIFHLAEAVRMHAMRLLGNGHIERAGSEIQATHRMAALMWCDGNPDDFLDAMRMQDASLKADLAILSDPPIDTGLASAVLSELSCLNGPKNVLEVIGNVNHFEFLDSVQSMAARVRQNWDRLNFHSRAQLRSMFGNEITQPDWDRVARGGNRFLAECDHMPDTVSAAGFKKWVDGQLQLKQKLFSAFKTERRDEQVLTWDYSGRFQWPWVGESRDDYSDRLMWRMLIIAKSYELEEMTSLECSKRLELTRLACALVLYRLDHGSYPARPEVAAAEYHLPAPAGFWGRPLEYEKDDGGFKLEVLGPASETRAEAEKSGDLITVEVRRP